MSGTPSVPLLIERYDRPYPLPLQKSAANVACHPCMLCVRSNHLVSGIGTVPPIPRQPFHDRSASTEFAIHLGPKRNLLPFIATVCLHRLYLTASLLLIVPLYVRPLCVRPLCQTPGAFPFHFYVTRQVFKSVIPSSWYVVC